MRFAVSIQTINNNSNNEFVGAKRNNIREHIMCVCVCLRCNMPLYLTWYSTPTETISLWSSYVCFRDFCTMYFFFASSNTYTSFHVICELKIHVIVAAVICMLSGIYGMYHNTHGTMYSLQHGRPTFAEHKAVQQHYKCVLCLRHSNHICPIA